MSKEKSIDLSIYVATYNHEDFIVRALKSIMMQKTRFSYEVWVGEDCSTDQTRAVLEKFEVELPENFHVLYRDHNMRNDSVGNASDLIRRCTGKYIIALEGDDYWIDEYKIEKQVSYLEAHSDCLAIAHDCIVVGKNCERLNETYPSCTDEIYTFRHYASDILPGQLTTVMYRREFREKKENQELFQKKLSPGDRATYFALLCSGRIVCFPDKMSAYRHVIKAGSSWSANYQYCYEDWKKFYSALILYSRDINHMEAGRIASLLFFRNEIAGIKRHQNTIKQMYSSCSCLQIGLETGLLYLKYKFRRDILHSKFWI